MKHSLNLIFFNFFSLQFWLFVFAKYVNCATFSNKIIRRNYAVIVSGILLTIYEYILFPDLLLDKLHN
jgi:hypothetical protein